MQGTDRFDVDRPAHRAMKYSVGQGQQQENDAQGQVALAARTQNTRDEDGRHQRQQQQIRQRVDHIGSEQGRAADHSPKSAPNTLPGGVSNSVHVLPAISKNPTMTATAKPNGIACAGHSTVGIGGSRKSDPAELRSTAGWPACRRLRLPARTAGVQAGAKATLGATTRKLMQSACRSGSQQQFDRAGSN